MRRLFLALVLAWLCAGCGADPLTGPTPVPRSTVRPVAICDPGPPFQYDAWGMPRVMLCP
jgi:hypothetical protein